MGKNHTVRSFQMLSNQLHAAYMYARGQIDRSDVLFPIFIRMVSIFRPIQGELLAGPGTEIVIEGFPRSANTYFTSAFELAQERSLPIARHLHASYQIRYAVRHGIPCVFLTREPVEAIASAIIRDPRLRAGLLLKNYESLYREVQKNTSRILVAPFDIAVSDPNRIIREVNRRYETVFRTLAEESIEEIDKEVERRHLATWKLDAPDPMKLALPSRQKARAAEALRKEIVARHPALVQRCRGFYKEVSRHSMGD